MDTLIVSLQQTLTEKGMTPVEFAQLVPCSKDEVWNWLKGRNKPNPASREGIARALRKIRGLPDVQPFEEMARDLAIYKSIKRRLTVADKLWLLSDRRQYSERLRTLAQHYREISIPSVKGEPI